ncbi:hypothetical protein J5893_04890 [bacterium]|nr:hypothetical protein [bacterium]
MKEEVTDLADFGLPTFKLTDQLFSSIEEVIAFCLNPETKKKLEQQDFDFDGLVVKVVGNAEENGASTSSLRDILGHTNHHPRWAIAYKFPAQQASTQILRVDFQVGRS